MKIPDRSFVVGVPGRIKGEVSPELLLWTQNNPEYCSFIAKKYKEELE
jgi:hypothetical protein